MAGVKVVIDTDPGTDDAIALMMALSSAELDVQGLTTVGGNASLAHTTRNALRLVDYLGRPELPVSRGATRPLRGQYAYGYYFHGPGGLTVRLPASPSRPRPLRAHDFLVSLAYSFPGELTVIALGPLTNLAMAMMREPRMKEWIREIVVMGGAVDVAGNVTPHAEFNVYNDPQAANMVLSSGIPTTLVGLDVCNEVAVSREDLQWLAGGSRQEALTCSILTNWFASHPGREQYNLCDPVAIVAALRPGLFTFRRGALRVETEDPALRGKTTAQIGGGPVQVASAVQADEAKGVIRALLRDSPQWHKFRRFLCEVA